MGMKNGSMGMWYLHYVSIRLLGKLQFCRKEQWLPQLPFSPAVGRGAGWFMSPAKAQVSSHAVHRYTQTLSCEWKHGREHPFLLGIQEGAMQ